MAVAFRDYYEVLGVPRDASAEDIRRAYRASRASTTPTSTRSRARRTASRRSPRPTRSCATRTSARATTGSARTGGPARTSRAPPGFGRLRGLRRGFGGVEDVRVEFGGGRLQRLLRRALRTPRPRAARRSGVRRLLDCAAPTRRPCSSSRSRRPRAAASGGSRSADGRDFEVNIPRGVRDGQRIRLAGEGEPGVGRRPAGRPLPARAPAAAPALPRRRARPLRRPAGRALGGRARRRRSRCRRSTGTRAREGARRAPRAGAGCGCAARDCPDAQGGAGDLYAVVKIMVPKKLSERGARALRAAREGLEVRPPEGALMAAARAARTRTVARRAPATGAPALVEIEALAREAGLHPDLVRALRRSSACSSRSRRHGAGAALPARRRGAPRARRPPAARPRPQLRRRRARVRAARAHRRTGSAAAPLRAARPTPEVIAWIRTG